MARTLIEVLQENNINLLDSSGGRRVAVCPFHANDNDPSFTIYPNDTYFCFGCKVWGDAVKFLIEFKGMSSEEALAHVGVDYKIPKADKAKVIKLKNTLVSWKFLYGVAEQYHQYLLKTEGAINYLRSRNLTEETIIKYKLGYTDGRVLNYSFAEDYSIGVDTGLLTKDGYEALSHRITVPNLLDKGECDFIIGRTVTNDKIKYLGLRVPKPVFGFHEIRQSPVVFLAEGQFDGLILRQWGFPAAVLGGSHITRQHQIMLNSKHVVYVPDNDPEGQKALRSMEAQFTNFSHVDYTKYDVKDVSELSNLPEAREKFIYAVKESCPWILSTSTRILNHWFPSLKDEILSL